jgi:hypothetical protein
MAAKAHNWAVLSHPSLQWTKIFIPFFKFVAIYNAPLNIKNTKSYHYESAKVEKNLLSSPNTALITLLYDYLTAWIFGMFKNSILQLV